MSSGRTSYFRTRALEAILRKNSQRPTGFDMNARNGEMLNKIILFNRWRSRQNRNK